MSDDLVKRLRDLASLDARAMPPAWQGQYELYSGAAARIEELEAKLAKAVEALVKIDHIGVIWSNTFERQIDEAKNIARITIAELKGQNNE